MLGSMSLSISSRLLEEGYGLGGPAVLVSCLSVARCGVLTYGVGTSMLACEWVGIGLFQKPWRPVYSYRLQAGRSHNADLSGSADLQWQSLLMCERQT